MTEVSAICRVVLPRYLRKWERGKKAQGVLESIPGTHEVDLILIGIELLVADVKGARRLVDGKLRDRLLGFGQEHFDLCLFHCSHIVAPLSFSLICFLLPHSASRQAPRSAPLLALAWTSRYRIERSML